MLSNILSILRIIAAPLLVFLTTLGRNYIPITVLIFTIASITDFFDGYFARKYNNSSTIFGIFIDPLADKILVLSMFFAFYLIGTIKLWIVVLLILRDVTITYLRITTLSQGHSLSPTKSAKLKTALQFVIIYFLFFLAYTNGNTVYSSLVEIMVYGIVGFTIWTGISYLLSNKAALRLQVHSIHKLFKNMD